MSAIIDAVKFLIDGISSTFESVSYFVSDVIPSFFSQIYHMSDWIPDVIATFTSLGFAAMMIVFIIRLFT